MVKCILKDINGDTKLNLSGEEINITYDKSYKDGDIFKITSDFEFLFVSFDNSQKISLVHSPQREFYYKVPVGVPCRHTTENLGKVASITSL